MLVACVLIQHYPFSIERERTPFLAGREVLVVQAQGARRTVLDTSPSIKDVLPGTPLAQAQSRHPLALLREADHLRYQQRFEELVAALEQVSPIVEPGEPGCIYVGLDGLASMYGGGEGLIKALVRSVPAALEPRFGIGGGKFPATVAAITARSGGRREGAPSPGPFGSAQGMLRQAQATSPLSGHAAGMVFFAPPDLQGFLAAHPVDVLPVSWETRQRLRRLGLRALGDIARQQVGPMQAQFGPEGRVIWEMSRGIDPRPLVPRTRKLRCTASLTFPAPTASLETLLLAVERLLRELFNRPELRGRYARTALLQGAVSRRPAWQRQVSFKEAAGSPRAAMPAMKRAFNLFPPPGPLEDLSLTLSDITGEAGKQASLFVDVRKQDQLREVIGQLEARLGARPPIYQFRDAEPWSRIPERRKVLVEYSP